MDESSRISDKHKGAAQYDESLNLAPIPNRLVSGSVQDLVLNMLTCARNMAQSNHDFQCYERAIDAVTQIGALNRTRDDASADLEKMDDGGLTMAEIARD